jgi:uncharacterized protein involved in tolerance to divalent cations
MRNEYERVRSSGDDHGFKGKCSKTGQVSCRAKVSGLYTGDRAIMSTYWWQGKIETAEEWLCLMETRQEIYAEVEAHIRAHHWYDEPEILAIPVVAGSRGYLDWLMSETERNKQ